MPKSKVKYCDQKAHAVTAVFYFLSKIMPEPCSNDESNQSTNTYIYIGYGRHQVPHSLRYPTENSRRQRGRRHPFAPQGLSIYMYIYICIYSIHIYIYIYGSFAFVKDTPTSEHSKNIFENPRPGPYSRHVCCVTQQTCLQCDATEMAAV